MPTGFEKFLKKTRKRGEKSAASKDEGNKEEKKQEDKKQEKDEDLTEEEEPEKEAKSQVPDNSAKKQINDFFMGGGGQGPKWENIALVAFLTGAFGFYVATMGT